MMTLTVMKTMMKVVMFFVLAAARSSSSSHHCWVLPPHRESPPCSCPACLPADHHYHPPADQLGPSFLATLLIITPVDKKNTPSDHLGHLADHIIIITTPFDHVGQPAEHNLIFATSADQLGHLTDHHHRIFWTFVPPYGWGSRTAMLSHVRWLRSREVIYDKENEISLLRCHLICTE